MLPTGRLPNRRSLPTGNLPITDRYRQ
ncbi:unnamed protein product, partial [Rotaria magnacalcarata]